MAYKDPNARRLYARKWRAENREAYNASQRTYRARRRAADIEGERERARPHHRKYRYGVTKDQFDATFAEQGNRCAVCRTADHRGRGWCQDHCRITGLARGVLCMPCNLALGYMRDDTALLEAGVAYLRKYQ